MTGLWQPGQSFTLAGFTLSLPLPDPWGSEQPIHRERPVATHAPPAQLCWSSSSSFPHICNHHELKLDSYKTNLTVEGHRLDNLPVPSMPWRPCTNLFFFELNINYRQIMVMLTWFYRTDAPKCGRIGVFAYINSYYACFFRSGSRENIWSEKCFCDIIWRAQQW